MSITHTLTLNWTNGNTLSASVAISADGEDNRDITVNAATNDVQVLLAATTASIKSIYILSDQDVTMETNSSSAADDTIALVADEPFVWTSTCGVPNPFTANITALYFSNAGASNALVKIRLLKDASP